MKSSESPSAPIFPLDPPRAKDIAGKTLTQVMKEMEEAIEIDREFGLHCDISRQMIEKQVRWRTTRYFELLAGL